MCYNSFVGDIMKKVELLSPVGNMKSLYYAVMYGADAVYLGGKRYGARSYADNFTNEELISAIKFCHLYGVKIYVTINTIIFDNEVDEFLEYAKFLYENNVDAVIVQDIGMIKLLREKLPHLEIHASTQVHNTNSYTTKFLKELGVKRVVLARELSLDEVKEIDCNIEKEVFIHGALCICYSGCCLFSAMNTNRSGNRGECVASCRLPYKLYENSKEVITQGDYLLSTKELNTIDHINELLDVGINSLKIEGRMKSPEYVGLITSVYRKAIDSYYEGKKFVLDKKTLNDMMSLYNRKYTSGHLFNCSYKELMNISTSNHQGVHIGNVIYCDKKIIKIKLDKDLNQEDAIRFINEEKGMVVNKLYNEKGLLVNKVTSGSIALVDNKVGLTEKGNVNKTIDKLLVDELSKLPSRKVDINVIVTAKVSKKLEISITDKDGNNVNINGDIVQEANNRPLSHDDIYKQINKIGNTVFNIENIKIDMDENIFVPNKFLNDIRRKALDKLSFIRENKVVKNDFDALKINNRTSKKEKNNINVLVRNVNQLKAALDLNVDNIYITDFKLYKEYKKDNIYFVLPRVINKYIDYSNENLLVRELGSIYKYKEKNNIIGDYTLNVSNNESLSLLSNFGLNRTCLSVETDLNIFKKPLYNTEILVYGRIEVMITKYCIMNMIINNDNKKCSLCMNNKYSLIDQKELKYPISREGHLMVIFDSKNIDLSDKIDLIKSKFNNIRINLFDEDYDESLEIINKYRGLYE